MAMTLDRSLSNILGSALIVNLAGTRVSPWRIYWHLHLHFLIFLKSESVLMNCGKGSKLLQKVNLSLKMYYEKTTTMKRQKGRETFE